MGTLRSACARRCSATCRAGEKRAARFVLLPFSTPYGQPTRRIAGRGAAQSGAKPPDSATAAKGPDGAITPWPGRGRRVWPHPSAVLCSTLRSDGPGSTRRDTSGRLSFRAVSLVTAHMCPRRRRRRHGYGELVSSAAARAYGRGSGGALAARESGMMKASDGWPDVS